MPSGPPEWHEYWSKKGPIDDNGDANAVKYLESVGFRQTNKWTWVMPAPWKVWDDITDDEARYAINYLIAEWDYGGVEPSR